MKLAREQILREALRIVDDDGMDALTMRRLAARLEVNPMSIYHHVAGKSAVVGGLIELVFGEMRLPDAEDMPWRDRVRAWALAYRDVALAHPHLVLEIVSDAAAVSRAALRVSEPLYAALEQAGLAAADVVRSADTLVDFIHGFVLAEAAQPTFDRGLFLGELEAQPPGAVPAMRRVFGALPHDEAAYEFDAGFEAGLAIVVSGIAARAGTVPLR